MFNQERAGAIIVRRHTKDTLSGTDVILLYHVTRIICVFYEEWEVFHFELRDIFATVYDSSEVQ